ncbi:MAG: hypothetical protein R2854_31175, partial [Caldilineaceae bacterium]
MAALCVFHTMLQRGDLGRAAAVQDVPTRDAQNMRTVRMIVAGKFSSKAQRVEMCVPCLARGHEVSDR